MPKGKNEKEAPIKLAQSESENVKVRPQSGKATDVQKLKLQTRKNKASQKIVSSLSRRATSVLVREINVMQ